MARKRFVFLSTVESFVLKLLHQFKSEVIFRRWGSRRLFVLLLLGVFLFTAAMPPVLSQVSNAGENNLSVEQVSQLVEQGRQHYENGEFEKAIESLQQAAKNFEKQKAWGNLASTLSNIGLSQLELGQSSAAFQSWEEAERYFSRINGSDKTGIIKSRVYQAQALQSLGLYSRACELITKTVLDNPLQCNALDEKVNTGNKDRSSWDLLTSAIQEKDNSIQAIVWHSLGDVLRVIGDLDNSEKALENGLKIAQSEKQKLAMHLSLGNTFRAKGNLERDRRSSPIYDYMPWLYDVEQQKERQKIAEAKVFYNKAIEQYKSAIKNSTSQTAPKSSLNLQAQLNYLSLLIETGDISAAQTLSSEIYSIENNNFHIKLSSKLTEIYAKVNLAKSLAFLKQASERNKSWEKAPSWDKVIKLIKASQQEAKDLKTKRGQSYALGNLGSLYEYLGRLDEAQQMTQEALYLAQPSELPDIAYQWQWQMGRLLKAQSSKREEAIASYETAVKTLESVRGDLLAISSDVQFSFRDNVEPLYRGLVDLQLKTEGTLDQTQKYLQNAIQKIDKLQLVELENFLRCRLPQTLQVDKILDQEDPTAAIFYPIILKNRLEVVLKIPGQKQLLHYKTRLDINKLENVINELRNQLSDPNSGSDEYEPLAKEIYDILIAKAEENHYLNKIKTLVFVLDGSLRKIPISTLWDGKHFLMEKYAVAVTPGLNILGPKPLPGYQSKVLVAGLTEGGAVTIGDKKFEFGNLPNINLEIESIKKTFSNSYIIKDKNFTSGKLLAELKNDTYPIIHLATHGNFSVSPKETFILESSNSIIDINHLQKLLRIGKVSKPNSIQFIVFSACQTAQGDKRAILGMAGIAIRAGANSTMATLWSVKDKSTALLTEKFYQNLKEGLEQKQINKAEALKKAQLSLRQSSEFSHPYFWSPFVIVGNWL